jgi:hypothetical protein
MASWPIRSSKRAGPVLPGEHFIGAGLCRGLVLSEHGEARVIALGIGIGLVHWPRTLAVCEGLGQWGACLAYPCHFSEKRQIWLMRSMLLCLLSMPLAASCDRVSAPAYPICENKFEVVSLNDLEWEQVDPTHVIQLDMHAQEPVLALLPSAKACDLIAADFVFPGRQVPHWFRGNTFSKHPIPGKSSLSMKSHESTFPDKEMEKATMPKRSCDSFLF